MWGVWAWQLAETETEKPDMNLAVALFLALAASAAVALPAGRDGHGHDLSVVEEPHTSKLIPEVFIKGIFYFYCTDPYKKCCNISDSILALAVV